MALEVDKRVIEVIKKRLELTEKLKSKEKRKIKSDPSSLKMSLIRRIGHYPISLPNCCRHTMDEKNLVLLINPNLRPFSFGQELDKEKKWHKAENYLRYILELRDVRSCNLLAEENIAFILYDYKALTLLFDIQEIKISDRNIYLSVSHCEDLMCKRALVCSF